MPTLELTAVPVDYIEAVPGKKIRGTVLDDEGLPARRIVTVLTRPDDLASGISTQYTPSSPWTGEFSFAVPDDNTLYEGVLKTPTYTVLVRDDDAGTNYNALVFDRVVPT